MQTTATGERLQSLGGLAAVVAAELGNPLASLSASLQLMARRGPSADGCNDLRREVERIARIATTLAAFSRSVLEQGRPATLEDTLRHALDVACHDPGWGAGEPCVEPSDGPSPLRTDAHLLFHVFHSLGMRLALPGGRVVVSVRHPPGRSLVTFRREGTLTEEGDGRLCLLLCRRIVEEHGGSLDACAGGLSVTLPREEDHGGPDPGGR